MPKRIVIHAGPGKTGTSAIQAVLNDQREALAVRGVLYPKHDMDSNRVSSGNRGALLDRTDDGNWTVSKDKVNTLRARFEASGCHTLLLSSEFFFRRIPGIHEHFPEAEFIAYLRHPIELEESGYNQRVKRHDRTSRFHLPDDFDYRTLRYVSRLLDASPAPDVVLRPYAKPLFTGGTILADLFAILGLDAPAEDQVVNPSYTFEALQFKRHANHFPLGRLGPELDRLLQRCDIGQRPYSLLTPQRYAELNGRVVDQLTEFLERHALDGLATFRDHVAATPPRPYHGQDIGADALDEIARWVKREAPQLHGLLAELAGKFPNLSLPNPHYYRCLGVAPSEDGPAPDRETIAALVARLRDDAHGAEADFCRELALYLEDRGDLEAASHFMAAAHAFRPNGEIIRGKLNDYRIRSGGERTSRSFRFRSLLIRLRGMLSR
ncbi:MAG: hypothetical protein AAGE01_09850 [Pseudomonadota bacterium]